jgi:hypothetical protein
MNQNGGTDPTRTWVEIVLTDVHFWVPAVVLVGGLLLLRFIR